MNMIEKVARAIDTAGVKLAKEQGSENASSGMIEPEDRKFIIELAKAAIEALREPTNDMANEYFKLRKEVGHINASAVFNVSVWETMIDAALKDTSPGD